MPKAARNFFDSNSPSEPPSTLAHNQRQKRESTQLSPPSMSVNLILFRYIYMYFVRWCYMVIVAAAVISHSFFIWFCTFCPLRYCVMCCCCVVCVLLFVLVISPPLLLYHTKPAITNLFASLCVHPRHVCVCVSIHVNVLMQGMCVCVWYICCLGLKLPSSTYHRHLCVHAYCI